MIPRLKQEYNVPVIIVQNDKSFEDYFYSIKQKGNHKGEIYGFPYTIGAWCNNRLKMLPLEKYFKKQGEHIRYIGIAYDEPKRFARLSDNEIAPLYNEQIIESVAKQICIDNDMLSPIYNYFDRDGCWFCPKQSLHSLKVIYDNFPDLWERLRRWQKDSPIPFSPGGSIFEIEKRFQNGYIPRHRIKV